MLEQALVDATALKEAALKSAQAAVLEAAQPKIEETVKALLEQEDEEGLDDLLGGGAPDMGADMGAGEVGDVAGGLSMAIQDGENMCSCPDEDEEIEIDFGELERQMVADEGAPAMGQEDLAQGLNLSGPGDELGAEMGLGAEPGAMEDEEDIDLDEDILSSLLEEEDKDKEDIEEGLFGNMFGGKKKTVQDMQSDIQGSMGEVIAQAEEIKAALAEKGITDYDAKIAQAAAQHAQNPDDLRSIVSYARVLGDALSAATGGVEEAKMTDDMMALASKDAHRDYMKDKGAQKPSKPAPRHKSLGQDFDLDTGDDTPLELAREGKMIVTKENLMEIVRSATKDLFTSQAEKEKENKKLKSLLRRLSEELKDTNLQNARLLYTNQILESVSLNERQKKKIVEAVSKAGSVDEAKVIYETLITSVGSSRQKRKPKSLREAVEKRSTPLVARRNKPEKASNHVAERMQKLAGIK